MNVEIGNFGNNKASQFYFLEIHKSEPDIYIGFSLALHLQCIPCLSVLQMILLSSQSDLARQSL
jgi:hypothetical protein